MKAWVVRAGKNGEREQFAMDNNVVVAGWDQLGDLSSIEDRQDLRTLIEAAYPDFAERRVINHVGQLWAFVKSIQEGDLVVLPKKTTRTLAFGRISGPYRFDESGPADARHVRDVQWLTTDLSRGIVGQDLLNSLGSALTIFGVEKNNGVSRIAALAQSGSDPGAAAAFGTAADISGDPTDEGALLDIEEIAANRIQAHIAERFAGHGLPRLVAAILEAEGYTTRVSPAGPDGGIDVLAGSGPLGLDSPTLAVQVKAQASAVEASVVRDLQGSASNVGADAALLVAWGGISGPARDHVKNLWFKMRVWTAQDVITKVTENYDRLSPEIQAELPLRQVWSLAVDDV